MIGFQVTFILRLLLETTIFCKKLNFCCKKVAELYFRD